MNGMFTPRLLHSAAGRQNALLNANASSEQRQIERRERRGDRDGAKSERQHGDLSGDKQIIGVSQIPEWAGLHEGCVGQSDDARRPISPQAHDYPYSAQLEQGEQRDQQPVGRGLSRHEYGEAREPAGMQQDEERVTSGICLHSALSAQPSGIAARTGKLDEPLECNQTECPVERGHRLSITRKPAVNPGPRAFISACSHRALAARALASIRSSTNITVAADMLP